MLKDDTSMTDDERTKLLIEVWKKTVDVQQHFNDIEMRVRNLALTILGAVVAFAKFLDLKTEGATAVLPLGYLFLALTVLIGAFWFMDKHWYHRLLMGAVLEGAALEKSLTSLGVPVTLGTNISKMSPIMLFGRRMHSAFKVDLFYLVLGTMGLLAAGGSVSADWFCASILVVVVIWCWWSTWWWRTAPKGPMG
jgi:hypothetical protein